MLLALSAFLSHRTSRRPRPEAVNEALDAGAAPTLLRILASRRKDAISAFEPLRLIACSPRGRAAIVGADEYARALIIALGLAHCLRLPGPSEDGAENNATPDTRADVVGAIGRIVEERPELGDVLFAAGLAAQLAEILLSPLARVERALAMQLTEKLMRHVPGTRARDAFAACGVLAEIHKVAVAARTCPQRAGDFPETAISGRQATTTDRCDETQAVSQTEREKTASANNNMADHLDETQTGRAVPSTSPGGPGDVPRAEPPSSKLSPLLYRRPEVVSEAEAGEARALMCRLAGYCGGILEVADVDGKPFRYTSGASEMPDDQISDPEAQDGHTLGRETPAGGTSGTETVGGRTSGPKTPDGRTSGRESAQVADAENGVKVRADAKAGRKGPSGRVCSWCSVASEKHLHVCSGCKRARYCDRNCQTAHWPLHKRECRG
jgi:hypothetical protein